MYPALNAWTLTDITAPEEQLAAAAAAGFAGLELIIGGDGGLPASTPTSEFVRLAERADELGLRIAGLATGLFWEFNYASPSEADRHRACDLTLRMLDAAAAARAGAILVVPAVVGGFDDRRPIVSYADALHHTLDALSTLRYEAETRAVTIAIENVWNRFLLSPLEAAELIDEIGSPYVGFYLDTGNVTSHGYAEDWVSILGGRIARVHVKDYDIGKPGWAGFCSLGEGSVNWPAVIHELRLCGYDGPMTYEGAGAPGEICRRLKAILAGQSDDPTEEEA